MSISIFKNFLKSLKKNNSKYLIFILLYIFINIVLINNILFTPLHDNSFNKTDLSLDKNIFIENYHVYRIETLINIKIQGMTTEQKIGQLFLLSIPYQYFDENTKTLIEDYYIGGIVIMSNNISSQTQLKDLINNIQTISNTKLLITTDQEGGTIARIPWDEARFISQPHIGINNREDFAYEVGIDHAQALKDVYINMNLSPVLDVSFIPDSSMATRTFGASSEKVSILGTQLILAYHSESIISTAKHFPGIGRSNVDSHKYLPEINISKDELYNEELIPFKEAIKNNVDVIMVGHAIYPEIDNNYPASLSNIFVTEILKNDLQFEGVILTDDINMDALKDYSNKASQAIIAGCDMILVVGDFENQINYINEIKGAVGKNEISIERLDESVRKILRLKYNYNIVN
jgi:beta-N-acetylhexosaminidase